MWTCFLVATKDLTLVLQSLAPSWLILVRVAVRLLVIQHCVVLAYKLGLPHHTLQYATCEFPFINLRSGLLLVAVSDYYQFDDLLTDEEKALRKKVRGIIEKEIAPIMTEVSSC